MSRFYFIIIVFFGISIVACKKSGIYTSIKLCENKGVITNYVIDSCEIKLDSLSTNIYGCLKSYEDSQVTYIVGYNNKTHCFDWFDLIKNEVSHTKLDNQGPHGLHYVRIFQVLSPNRILVSQPNKYCIINKKGDILKSFSTEIDEEDKRIFNYHRTRSLCYDSINCEIVSASFIPKQKGGLFAKVNFNTKKVVELPINHLDSHIAGINKYGGWIYTYILDHKDDYIYNYNYSSDIFFYNENDNKYSKVEYKSTLSKNLRTPPVSVFQSAKATHHHLNNPFFKSIIYDSDRDLFYRVHNKMINKNASDLEKKYYSVDHILTFFDDKFENAYEFFLSKDKYFTGDVFDFKRGYAIICNNPIDPNYNPDLMKIHFYNFKLKL